MSKQDTETRPWFTHSFEPIWPRVLLLFAPNLHTIIISQTKTLNVEMDTYLWRVSEDLNGPLSHLHFHPSCHVISLPQMTYGWVRAQLYYIMAILTNLENPSSALCMLWHIKNVGTVFDNVIKCMVLCHITDGVVLNRNINKLQYFNLGIYV